MPRDQAYELVRGVLVDMGLELVREAPEQGEIEAVATTFWFGFKDDLVVRLRDTDGGTRMDVRSGLASRRRRLSAPMPNAFSRDHRSGPGRTLKPRADLTVTSGSEKIRPFHRLSSEYCGVTAMTSLPRQLVFLFLLLPTILFAGVDRIEITSRETLSSAGHDFTYEGDRRRALSEPRSGTSGQRHDHRHRLRARATATAWSNTRRISGCWRPSADIANGGLFYNVNNRGGSRGRPGNFLRSSVDRTRFHISRHRLDQRDHAGAGTPAPACAGRRPGRRSHYRRRALRKSSSTVPAGRGQYRRRRDIWPMRRPSAACARRA